MDRSGMRVLDSYPWVMSSDNLSDWMACNPVKLDDLEWLPVFLSFTRCVVRA